MTAPPTPPTAPPPASSYWGVVSAQFRKNRGAVWGVRVLGVLFAAATYAPLLAHNVPLWTDLPDAGASPWLSSLFDPTVFPLPVDVFFNVLMGTLPAAAAIWFLARGRRRTRGLLLWAVAHVGLVVWVNGARDDWRRPPVDWAARVAGADARAVWPPLRHHPAERRSEFALTQPFRTGEAVLAVPEPPGGRPFYVLGADNVGNDVLTRVLYGARISLTIGVLAVGLYVTIGILLGGLAGYFGGWVDETLLFLAQVVMTLPVLFVIMFFLSMREEKSIYQQMLIIALLWWPTVMRLVRGEFLRQREIDYVAAARALGLSDARIIFRHITPNTLAPVLVSATFGVAGAILIESTLSFLGLGDPSAPSWGQLLKVGFENSLKGRHLIWAGGLAIFATVLLLNLVGEGLRDALDPKLRR